MFRIPLLLALIVLLAAASCAPGRPIGRMITTDGGREIKAGAVIKDGALNGKLAIDSIDCRIVNGMPQAQVVVRNNTRHEIGFVYRFVWTDAQGYDLSVANTIWKEGYVQGNSTEGITAVATSNGAASFYMEIGKKK